MAIGHAQTGTYSPYSRFGLGELHPQRFSQSRGMGGLSYGLRLPNTLNIGNPASYSSIDTLSFVFDVGMSVNRTNFTSGTEPGRALVNNYSFDHLAFAFHIKKWWVASVGIIPYSQVGYNIKQEMDPIPDIGVVNVSNVGSGGFNRLVFGNGFHMDRFSFGFNASYLFGSLSQQNTLSFPLDASASTTISNKQVQINRFYLEYGMQYSLPVGERDEMVFGAVFQTRTKLKANRESITITQRQVTNPLTGQFAVMEDTVSLINDKAIFHMPLSVGLGVSYLYDKKLLVGIDYTRQQWSNTDFPWDGIRMENTNQLNVGMQFSPNPRISRNFLDVIQYRAGFSYSDTSLKLNGKQIKDVSFSLGIGLPVGGRSLLNLSYENGLRGTTSNGLVKQKYQGISLSLSFYDLWFYRPLYD